MKAFIIAVTATVLALCAALLPRTRVQEQTHAIDTAPRVAAENALVAQQEPIISHPTTEAHTPNENTNQTEAPVITEEEKEIPETPTPQLSEPQDDRVNKTDEVHIPELEYVPHGGDNDENILEDVYEYGSKLGAISATVPQMQNTETESEPDIPTVMVSAKTGHDEPVKQIVIAPEPTEQTADIDAAIATAEQFAVEMYHVTIDHTLDFDNSGYRFPAAVPLTVLQETFDAKAIDIVTFTFEQMIQAYGKTLEQIRAAGFRCHVCVVKGSDLQIYCLYA